MEAAKVHDSPAPSVVIVDFLSPSPDTGAADVPRLVAQATCRALAVLQQFLADERYAASRLLFVTRGAVATAGDTDVPDLAVICTPAGCGPTWPSSAP